MSDTEETPPETPKFDFSAFPENTLFYDRREKFDRRDRPRAYVPPPVEDKPRAVPERRAKKERRRRIDPTTFEKQYTDDELEFMNAMQDFKTQSGKSFPSHGEVLRVAAKLGYRKAFLVGDEDEPCYDIDPALTN
jgi:hypothetical protein